MRMGKKKLLQFTAVALCMACLTGCGKGTDLPEDSSIPVNVQDISAAGSEGQQQTEGTGVTGDTELPEGYVYDYQVSLEPIPQEIADLGGMCVGTMHAFPSRIMVGLMKQRMEEDPELKAEVEKRVEEVKQSLSEEIGGEFEVEIMEVEGEGLFWGLYCTEMDTDYKFNMYYVKYKHYKPAGSDHIFTISDYYSKFEVQKCEDDIRSVIAETYEDICTNIWCREGIKDEMDIYIYAASFTNEEVNYKEEQIKIINLWKALQEYDKDRDYRIYIGFYPTEYEGLIRYRCEQGTWWDIHVVDQEKIEKLFEEKEIYDFFCYASSSEDEYTVNMDTLLDEYEKGTYDKTDVWDFWLKGENENE